MLIYFQGQIGTPSSARLISKLLTESGADHVITMDLHSELVINLKDDSNLTENIGDNSPCYDFIDYYHIVLFLISDRKLLQQQSQNQQLGGRVCLCPMDQVQRPRLEKLRSRLSRCRRFSTCASDGQPDGPRLRHHSEETSEAE